jgi:hypothetical protein
MLVACDNDRFGASVATWQLDGAAEYASYRQERQPRTVPTISGSILTISHFPVQASDPGVARTIDISTHGKRKISTRNDGAERNNIIVRGYNRRSTNCLFTHTIPNREFYLLPSNQQVSLIIRGPYRIRSAR